MPRLACTLPSTRGAVGFELPIFQAYRGANTDLLQEIAPDGTIRRFNPSWLSTQHAIRVHDLEVEVEKGEEAIWAFRDEEQRLVVGSRSDIIRYGLEALKRECLIGFPLAAAEMAAFCNAQRHFPDILRRAFEHLSAMSTNSAGSWLDTSILLPAIREDMAEHYGKRVTGARQLSQIIAVSKGNHITIYGPKHLVSQEIPLTRSLPLAEIFGINDVKYVSYNEAQPSPRELVWKVAGTGGMIQHALTGQPFQGVRDFNQVSNISEITAVGDSKIGIFQRPQLLVRVFGSDPEEVEYAKSRLVDGDHFRYRHVINIRPMGYGTPRASKVSSREVFKGLSHADVVWLAATHRLRQTGTPRNNLGPLHTASRTLTGALQALVTCIDAKGSVSPFFEQLKKTNSLGVVGTWRYNNNVTIEENLTRLVFNLLCEDVLLHKAKRIVVVWSFKKTPAPKTKEITLGNHRYEVEFLTPRNSSLGSTLVAFAIGVDLASGSSSDFKEFCVSLFAGYGWWQTLSSLSSAVMQQEHKSLRVFTCTATKDIPSLLEQHFGETFLILTNKTLPQGLRHERLTSDTKVIHYSELGRWLQIAFGGKILADHG